MDINKTNQDLNTNITRNTNSLASDWILHHDFILTVLIPFLLIFALLLVTIIIACVLHRTHKKRKIPKLNTEMLHPRSPIIFASEPGRYDDTDLLHRRLFIEDEDTDHPPEYEDWRELLEKSLLPRYQVQEVKQSSQLSRTLPRVAPSYSHRKKEVTPEVY